MGARDRIIESSKLNEQISRLIRSERQLYETQVELEEQLDRINTLNEFSLAILQANAISEILVAGFNLLSSIFVINSAFAVLCDIETNKAVEAAELKRGQGASIISNMDIEIKVNKLPIKDEATIIVFSKNSQAINKVIKTIRSFKLFASFIDNIYEGETLVVLINSFEEGGYKVLQLLHCPAKSQLAYREEVPGSEDLSFISLFCKHENSAIENIIYHRKLQRFADELEHKVQLRTEELNASREKLHSIIENTNDWIWEVDKNLVYTEVSPKIKELLGYSPNEVLGTRPFDYMPREEARRVLKEMRVHAVAKSTFIGVINSNIHKNGSKVILESSGVPLLSSRGEFQGFMGIDRDITERKTAEQQMQYRLAFERIITEIARDLSRLEAADTHKGIRQALAKIGKFIRASSAHIVLFDKDTVINIADSGVTTTRRLTKQKFNDFYVKFPHIYKTLQSKSEVYLQDIKKVSKRWGQDQRELQQIGLEALLCMSLNLYDQCIGFTWFGYADKELLLGESDLVMFKTFNELIVSTIERQKTEARLERLARFDSLTNLPNRLFLKEALTKEIAISKRHNYPFALLSLDLDKFKYINDTYGHNVGDLFLLEISKRIKECVRKEDFVARLGGDEFVIVLVSIQHEHDAGVVANKVVNALGGAYKVAGHEFSTTVSIGIACYPSDGRDVGALMKNADIAMYYSKQCGGGAYQYFRKELSKKHIRRLSLENALISALDNHEFFLVYQPRYALHANKIVGIEALLRWQHPKLGVILPEDFIPLAEESRRIIGIGGWVIQNVFATISKWCKHNLLDSIPIAINLSAVQLLDI